MAGRTVLEVGPGDVLVLAPRREGFLRASQLGEVSLHQFLLCPELLSGLLTLRELSLLESARASGGSKVHHFAPEAPLAAAFAALATSAASSEGMMPRIGMLQVAAAFFDREWRTPRPSDGAFLTSRQRIRALLQQLTEAEVLGHSAGDLAARCNCSPRHFNRLFTRFVGASFRAKQAELRLRKARQLLYETDQPIAQVSVALGYRHPGLFNAQFKRQFGMSPQSWRERHRPKPGPAEALQVGCYGGG